MASTVFTDYNTVIVSAWLNDVNAATYNAGVPVTAAGVQTQIASTLTAAEAYANGTCSVVGGTRNLKATLAAPNASATWTASEATLETALGGTPLRVANVNVTCNLGTVGVNGMDTGTAPVSGFVAVYLIWNPTTLTLSSLATNATAAAQPDIYGGGHMPAGYTFSALISVVATSASSLFAAFVQLDRVVSIAILQALVTNTQQASPTMLTIASAVPLNAKSVSNSLAVGSSAIAQATASAYSTVGGLGQQEVQSDVSAAGVATNSNYGLLLPTPQTIWYTCSATAGTMIFYVFITGYTI